MSKTKLKGSSLKPIKSSKLKVLNDDENWNEYFELPNPDLQAHFMRTRKGVSDVYTSPFFGLSDLKSNDEKLDKLGSIVSGWMQELENSDVPEKWPSLMEYENDQREKVGPMSIMKPLEERMDDVDSYYSLINVDAEYVDEAALEATIREFWGIRNLRIRGQKLVWENMKKSTNSGAPFYMRRKNAIEKTYPCEIWVRDFLHHTPCYWSALAYHTPKYSQWKNTAILGWRGQEGGPTPDDVKQRVIWMFPLGVNLCELQWYQPFIEAVQKFNIVPAWVSMDAVDARITALFDTKATDDLVVCTDFSKFDQHFNRTLQHAAYRVQWALRNEHDDKTEGWFLDVFDQKYCIPLAYDEGRVRIGYHGMASGSGGTNVDETVAHRALQHEVALRNGEELNPNSQCMGDDGIISFPGITAEKVMLSYRAHGLEMNPIKQYESTQDCVYLRRWHHTNFRENGICVGVYPTVRALNRMAMQERWYDPDKWSKEMVALRYLSILENCKYHPLRERFADYCMKGDKYRLGIDIPGFLSNIDQIAAEATENMPDFLGYTKSMQKGTMSGLSEWWIVKYLKSKA